MVRAQYSAICFPLQAISRTRRRASVKQLPRGSRCRRAPSMRPRIQTPQTDFDFFGGESNKEELGTDYSRRLASSRRGIRGVQDALFPLALCTPAPCTKHRRRRTAIRPTQVSIPRAPVAVSRNGPSLSKCQSARGRHSPSPRRAPARQRRARGRRGGAAAPGRPRDESTPARRIERPNAPEKCVFVWS